MFYKIPLNADLTNTSYRCKKYTENAIYIEYNEGAVFDEWEEISEAEARNIAPEWFVEETNMIESPTQLDRIESAVSNTLEEIRAEAVDEYTLSLMENNII